MGKLINTARLLGKLNMPFRGHKEDEESLNRGVFKEFVYHMSESDPILFDHINNFQGNLLS